MPMMPKKRKANAEDIADRNVTATFQATKRQLIKGPKSIKKGDGKKKMKLNPKFKAAVKQVFTEKENTGRLFAYYAGGWNANVAQNKQGIQSLPQLLSGTSGSDGIGFEGYLFSPYEIVRAADDIFGYSNNSAVFLQESTPYRPLGGVPKGFPVPTDTDWASTFKVTIVNSYLKINMFNNTARTFHLDFYECEPKKKSTSGGLARNIDGVNVVSNYRLLNPLDEWDDKVATLKANGALSASYVKDDYFSSPLEIPGMKESWNWNMKRITIGPGQKDNLFIQGPKGYTFDWTKNWKNGLFMDVGGFSKWCFCILRNDQYTSATNNGLHGIPGYVISNSTEAGVDPKLQFLAELHYKMKMPEITGGYVPPVNVQIPTAPFVDPIVASISVQSDVGQPFQNDRRRGNILRKHYFYGTPGNVGVTTFPENPISYKNVDQ